MPLLLIVSCTPASSPIASSTVPESPTSQPAPTETNPPPPSPTAIPTAIPISEGEYDGWWTYTHPLAGFSLQLLLDWVVDETTRNPAMDANTLIIRPEDERQLMIPMTFRKAGEETYIWPTGVGSEEFLEGDTLEIATGSAKRMYFFCPTG